MENRVFYTFTDENDGNLAFHVEDNEINVIKNRKNLALKLGYNYEDLVYMNQIHSSNIIVVDENSPKLVDNCDLLVMGTHGHTTFKDILFGTTVESVRHKIDIPLVLV